MVQRTYSSASLILGLLSVGLTLGVWAYIFVRAPQGAIHGQGGMFILFPLTPGLGHRGDRGHHPGPTGTESGGDQQREGGRHRGDHPRGAGFAPLARYVCRIR
jgi:hypothetical protein